MSATAMIATGLVLAVAAPASAHTGDVTAKAVCNTQTGEYDVTYTLTLTNVPRGQVGSTKTHTGGANFVNGWNESSFSWEGGPYTVSGDGQVTWSATLPGTTKGNGPWVYAFTRWSPDGYTVKSDTRVEGLQGTCSKPFNWDWQYAAPTCTALTVNYPADIPSGQANDANVRIVNLQTNEEQTLNFHNNSGTWSGTHVFDFTAHPNWPGWTYYKVVWTQVAGTNYHWSGTVICGHAPPVVTKDASASVTPGVATCDGQTPNQPTFSIEHATWGDVVDNGNGTFSRTATADENHAFEDGTTTKTVTWSNPAPLPSQSTDPKGQCYVPPVIQQCEVITDGGLATNLNDNGWDYSESRTKGHHDYVENGLHVYTDSNDTQSKAAGYHALNVPLSQVGEPSIDMSDVSGVAPGLQLGVDIDGNGTWDGYLVNEGDTYGHGMWWTNKSGFGVAPGGGYPSLGTLNDYLAANPKAVVLSVGFSLGSGVKGDALIHSITAGCTTFTFGYATPPLVKDASASATPPQAVCTGEEQGGTTFSIEHATWSDITTNEDGSFSRVATADKGHAFADGSTTKTVTWSNPDKLPSQSTNPDEPCYVPPTVEPTPLAPVFADQQCTKDGPKGQNTIRITEVEGLIYTIVFPGNHAIDVKSTDYVDGVYTAYVNDYYGDYTVTVRKADGSEWKDGVTSSWKHDFANVPCSTTTPKPPTPPVDRPKPQAPTGNLAQTGADLPIGASILGLVLLLVGAGAVGETRLRRRHHG